MPERKHPAAGSVRALDGIAVWMIAASKEVGFWDAEVTRVVGFGVDATEGPFEVCPVPDGGDVKTELVAAVGAHELIPVKTILIQI